MKKLSHLLVMFLVVSFVVACAAPTPAAQPAPAQVGPTTAPVKPLRIAAVLPGKVDDGTFNQMMYEGLQGVKQKFGDKVDISWVENKYQVADIEPALQDYASQGFDLVIGHGFQFQDPIIKIAKQYPNVHFAIGSGAYMTADNVVTYDADNDELGYALGAAAGLATKTNKIGEVLGLIVPNVAAMQNGYHLGAKAVNPNVQVTDLVVGSFDDAGAAQEAANTLIGQGADVVFSVMNNAATMEVTELKGVYGEVQTDLTKLYPKSDLASTPSQYGVAVEEMVNDIWANKFGNKHYVLSFENGGMKLNYRSDLDQSVKDKLDAIVNDLKSRKLIVPTGTPSPQ